MGNSILSIAVHRPLGGKPFDARLIREHDDLFAHVRRVLMLRHLLTAERTRADRLEAILDQSGNALLLVSRDLRVVNASSRAEALLAAADGLRRTGQRLAHARLRAGVMAIHDRRGGDLETFVAERPSARAPYRLMLMPAGSASADGVMVLIDDPERGGTDRRALLHRLHGLTIAEAEVADRLADGETLQAIGAKRGTKIQTVRSQVKAIMAKMGLRGRRNWPRTSRGCRNRVDGHRRSWAATTEGHTAYRIAAINQTGRARRAAAACRGRRSSP